MIPIVALALLAGSYPQIDPAEESRLAGLWIGRTPAELIDRLGKYDGGREDPDGYWLDWTDQRNAQRGSFSDKGGVSGTTRYYPALICKLSVKVQADKITRLTLSGHKQMCRKLVKAAGRS